jgi:LEA14-like dessication related protein
MSASFPSRVTTLGLALLALSCATTRTPTLQVEGLRVDRVRVTGAGLNVNFRVQNPNPEPLLIERFEYELKLNGRRLGRGYHAESVPLEGFKDARVASRFALNFLSLPGTVRAILEQDRARVSVSGAFYVRQGSGLKKLGFKNDANVDLKKL